jgi:diguanylate cyclase (GGDEF)-like protein
MTGLFNRKGFADHGQQLCVEAAANGHKLVILSIQMHRYKSINDRHGYEVGDQLLRLIAESICDSVPAGAVIARLSGDEFAVALGLADDVLGQAELAGEAILRGITRPFDIDGKMIQVGAFVGIASHDAADGQVPDLLRRADIAMDHAKSGRVARPVWFDAGMERALVAHSEIEQGIRFGLEHDQFVPYFEPQVDLATGSIIGFEVLARWNHPLSGIIGPDVFIPVAEEIGAIGRLSEKVIRAALTQAASWDQRISISVNISPTQLADSWLAQKIVRLLTETGFPAERLVIEITESSLFADLELARSIVTSLKNQGIRLALDDFGSGFSSLSHLRSLPFDVIKVDRSFIATIHRDRESAAIVRAVTTLANAIGVPVTVEGIEDAETHDAVIGFGCAVGQGWYFGKPMTGDQAEQLLHTRAVAAPVTLPRSAAG